MRADRALATLAVALAVCAACNTGRVSLGYDDDIGACGPMDCSGLRPTIETCTETMGHSRCERGGDGTCQWFCRFPVACQASDCGALPADLAMCVDGGVDEYGCERNAQQQCEWTLPPCAAP